MEPVRTAAALEELGEGMSVGGHQPILLSDPDAVYVVETGRVEIFAVEIHDRQPGLRSHYLTVDPGGSFFGFDVERYGMSSQFLAVGRIGTTLHRMSLSRLRQLAADGQWTEEIRGWLETWVLGLSRRLTQEWARPTVDVNLLAEQSLTLERDGTANSHKGLLWLDIAAGDLLFIGLEPLSLPPRTLFPICPETWVEAFGASDVRLTAHATRSALGEGGLWRGLEAFREALCRCEFINKKLAMVDELNRLKSRAEYAEAARETALNSLAAVLETSAGAELLAEPPDADLAYRTLAVVGRRAGIRVVDHPDIRDPATFEERIAIIARASKIRTRRVALRGAWWTADHGPLVGRWAETGEPVALLPDGPRAYLCLDLDRATRTPVTEEVAARLAGSGLVLYRTFPEGPLGILGLVRFAARDLSREIATLVTLGIALGLLATLTPYLTGWIFDAAVPQAEVGLLGQLVLALVVAALAMSAFRFTQSIAMLRIGIRSDYAIQAALWDRLLKLPSTFFRDFDAGDLADRAAGLNAIRGVFAGTGLSAVLGTLSSLFYIGLMAWYSSALAWLAVGLTTVFVGFTTAASLLQLRLRRAQFESRGRISGLVLQLVSGVAKLRVASAENHAFRVWAQQFSEHRRIGFKVGKIQNNVAIFHSAFPIFSSMAIFAVMTALRAEAQQSGAPGTLSTGEFIAFSAAYGLFLGAMQALADAALQILASVPLYERLKPIVTAPAEIGETKSHPGKLHGAIELSHVHFRYLEDGPWTLKDVSLAIRTGELVALVGASGSGKSTLLRLLLGFEKPEKGSIYYDGQELAHLDLQELRPQLGVVLQDSQVLPADIYRNIVGTSPRSLEEAWEAARLAGLDDDIRQMPMGMHTRVSEGGGGLSGGQRQRLLIARAVIHKPRILFMDEATSALDNRTQAAVVDSLDRLQATRVVIAHRLSTIRNADRICFLEGGVIEEMGTYEELMEIEGKFAKLARRQMV